MENYKINTCSNIFDWILRRNKTGAHYQKDDLSWWGIYLDIQDLLTQSWKMHWSLIIDEINMEYRMKQVMLYLTYTLICTFNNKLKKLEKCVYYLCQNKYQVGSSEEVKNTNPHNVLIYIFLVFIHLFSFSSSKFDSIASVRNLGYFNIKYLLALISPEK